MRHTSGCAASAFFMRKLFVVLLLLLVVVPVSAQTPTPPPNSLSITNGTYAPTVVYDEPVPLSVSANSQVNNAVGEVSVVLSRGFWRLTRTGSTSGSGGCFLGSISVEVLPRTGSTYIKQSVYSAQPNLSTITEIYFNNQYNNFRNTIININAGFNGGQCTFDFLLEKIERYSGVANGDLPINSHQFMTKTHTDYDYAVLIGDNIPVLAGERLYYEISGTKFDNPRPPFPFPPSSNSCTINVMIRLSSHTAQQGINLPYTFTTNETIRLFLLYNCSSSTAELFVTVKKLNALPTPTIPPTTTSTATQLPTLQPTYTMLPTYTPLPSQPVPTITPTSTSTATPNIGGTTTATTTPSIGGTTTPNPTIGIVLTVQIEQTIIVEFPTSGVGGPPAPYGLATATMTDWQAGWSGVGTTAAGKEPINTIGQIRNLADQVASTIDGIASSDTQQCSVSLFGKWGSWVCWFFAQISPIPYWMRFVSVFLSVYMLLRYLFARFNAQFGPRSNQQGDK